MRLASSKSGASNPPNDGTLFTIVTPRLGITIGVNIDARLALEPLDERYSSFTMSPPTRFAVLLEVV